MNLYQNIQEKALDDIDSRYSLIDTLRKEIEDLKEENLELRKENQLLKQSLTFP